jgi:hypothetical protein
MKICLVSLNAYLHDTRARVLGRSLVAAGHDVTVIAAGSDPETDVDGARVRFVATRYPRGGGRRRRFLRRIQPRFVRRALFERALARAAGATGADVFHPTSAAAVPVAARAAGTSSVVAREPAWPDAGAVDLIRVAPDLPTAAVSGAGDGLGFFTPGRTPLPGTPEPGRHGGTRIALCYRKTDTNPGRYLEAAMRRAGIAVDVYTTEVPWTRIAASTDGVVFVESPYPALDIQGENPGFPVLFWVHHGEHRLLTNVRLCDRYGAHGVMLSHSWHLAHRFPVPVHRFPFAVAPELHSGPVVPLEEREYDVAFVGAGLRSENAAYARRRELLAQIENALGADRVAFLQDISAQRMASTYGRARVVIDEGGTRHFPITMRVFEAVGSGALLLSDAAPGIGRLLVEGEHFLSLGDDVVASIAELTAAPERMQRIASAGYDHAWSLHTYDHRVDDLMAAFESVRGATSRPSPARPAGLAGLVDSDAEVQRVLTFGEPGLALRLPLREVWEGEQNLDRVRPGAFDAVVIGAAGSPHLDQAVGAARRFVYASVDRERISRIVAEQRPGSVFDRTDGLLRVTLNAQVS